MTFKKSKEKKCNGGADPVVCPTSLMSNCPNLTVCVRVKKDVFKCLQLVCKFQEGYLNRVESCPTRFRYMLGGT